MNTKTKKLLYLLFLYLNPLQAAQKKETGIVINQLSSLQIQMDQEEKKEDPEDNLQNDPPFNAYDPTLIVNHQQEKPIIASLDSMSVPLSQPVDGFEITQCIQQTKNNITEFLDQYAHSFNETIRVCFHTLSGYSSAEKSDSKSKEITEATKSLIKCFETLQGISTRTPDVFKKLFQNDNPITVAQNKLQNLSKDIKKTIDKQKQQTSSSLNHTLQVLEYLTILDGYLPEKSESTFSQIYQKNSQAFYSDVIELPKVQKNMDNKNYKDVANSMKDLLEITQSSSKDIRAKRALQVIQREVKKDLEKRIKVIRQAIMLSQGEVEPTAIMKLQNNLATLDTAMEIFCPKDCNLLDESSQNELFKQKTQIYQSLAEWMKEFITEIETFINSLNFLGAEKYIYQFKKIKQILGENMIETDENNKEKNPYKEIVNDIKKVEEKIQKKLQEQIDCYKKITLHDETFNPYSENPPVEFCLKLKAAETKHSRYSEAISSIKRDIFDKVRKLMMQGLKNPMQTKKCFNLCRNILTSLPKEWAKTLEIEIKLRSEEAKEREEREDTRIMKIIATGVTDDMYKLLRELKKKGETINASKVENKIRIKSQERFKNIQEYINKDKIKEACCQLAELYEEKCRYSELCPFIEEHHEAAHSRLSDELKIRANYLMNNLSSPNRNKTKSIIETMNTYLKQIQQFETYRAQTKK